MFWHGSCKYNLRVMSTCFGTEIARLYFENENHYYFLSYVRTKNPLIEDLDNRKVYEVKGVLMCVVLLRYRYVCFGMVLAQIHPHIQGDFTTLITHIQRTLS